jgi:hypothetical protein
VVRYAATPTFALSLNITENTGVRLHAIALRCQIRIEPHRRRYTADEARRLNELFGDTHSWAEPAKPLQLATLTALVPGFTSRTELDLQVPCSYDLEVASARYLQVLEDGIIPLLLLFSGTVFVDRGHTYSVELIPWSLEVPFPMPVRVWHDVIEEHFPGSAWLRCSRQTLDALAEFKSAYALPTWDAALSALLQAASVPWDPSAYADPLVVPPDWHDAQPEPEAAAAEPEAAAAEPGAAAAQPGAAAAQPGAAAAEPVDVTPEPRDAAPRPADIVPEPRDAARESQDAPPEPQSIPREPQDAAPEEAASEEAVQQAVPEEAAPEEAASKEAASKEAASKEAAPDEAAPEGRVSGTGGRRTGTAARRRPAARRSAPEDAVPEERDKPRRGRPAGHYGDGGGSPFPPGSAVLGPGTRSPVSSSPDSR